MSTLRVDQLQTTDSSITVNVSDLMAAGFTVGSVSELKSVDTSKHTWAYRTGYATSGDSDGSLWYYDPLATGTETAALILPNSGIGRWKLNHNGTIPVGVAGAKGDGVTDDRAAIQRAHDTKLTVTYKPVTYRSSGKITATAPFGMIGGGIARTYIDFTGATAGYEVTQNNALDGFYVAGVSLLTNLTPASGQVGLKLNGVPQVGTTPDAAGHRQIGDRTMFRGTVRDFEARGKDITQGWYVGLNFLSIMNFTAQNIIVRGQYQSSGNYDGVGVLVNGDGIPTDFTIDRIWTFYTSHSVFFPDYVEGGHITNFEFVHTIRGVHGQYDVNWSTLPQSICGALSMFVDNGHVNARLYGVYLENTNQDNISNLNLYLNALGSDGFAAGVYLKGGATSSVSFVKTNGDACVNTKANNHGVMLTTTSLSSVSDCFMAGGGSAVRLLENCSNNDIHHNRAITCVNTISSDTSDVSNLYSENFGSGLSGQTYEVGANNKFNKAQYVASVVRTLTGGQPNETVGLVIPPNTFSGKPTSVIMQPAGGSANPSFLCSYDYDNASNSATTAVMNVRLASGANLPAGSYRFSLRVEE